MSDQLSRQITRRQFLEASARLGLGATALPWIIAACTPGGTRPPAGGGAPTTTPAPGARRPIEFTAWEFQPDTIKQHLKAWSDVSGVRTNLSLIPNVGYGPAIQTKLQGGAVIDVYYNFTYNTAKFVDQGWARNLADLPQAQDMLGEMFEGARARYVLPDGRIISAPYFNAVHVLHYNQEHLKKAGIAAPPQTLQEQYDQAKKLKDAGISKTPYVAYWIKEFAEEYLMVYLLAEGITPFDDQENPVFADDAKSVAVMEWWQAMFRDKLTTPTMLTDDPIKLATLMGTGGASFYVLHHYFLKIIRDLKGTDAPQKDNVTIHYRVPGSKGDTLHMGEVIQMGTKAEGPSRDDAWSLMKWYGWKDNEGNLRTFKSWATAGALACPYPAFFTDPEVKTAFGAYYDMDALSRVFQTGSNVVPVRNRAWYQPFQVKVGDRIHALLLGQASPQDTVKGLADDAKSARQGGI